MRTRRRTSARAREVGCGSSRCFRNGRPTGVFSFGRHALACPGGANARRGDRETRAPRPRRARVPHRPRSCICLKAAAGVTGGPDRARGRLSSAGNTSGDRAVEHLYVEVAAPAPQDRRPGSRPGHRNFARARARKSAERHAPAQPNGGEIVPEEMDWPLAASFAWTLVIMAPRLKLFVHGSWRYTGGFCTFPLPSIKPE
jgi:hypothetical protein